MADIFYQSTGSLSALTPQKVAVSSVGTTLETMSVVNVYTPQSIPFTPTVATSTCEGVFLGLNIPYNYDGTKTITVQLQDGGVDVAGAVKTLTYDQVIGTHVSATNARAAITWKYFKFATPAAITTDALRWSLYVTTNNPLDYYPINLTKDGSGNFYYAIILTGTTTYSSGDTAFFCDETVTTLDQDTTFTSCIQGGNHHLVWENPPSSSYTFTATHMFPSLDCAFICGTSSSRIPYAEKATINVTNWRQPSYIVGGALSQIIQICGTRFDHERGVIASTAASSQKDIVLTEDLSSYWAPGDTLWVFGTKIELATIDSISGATVTVTTNLSYSHAKDWYVINKTRSLATAGVLITGSFYSDYMYGRFPVTFDFSGVVLNKKFYIGFYYAYVDTARVTPWLLQDIIIDNITEGTDFTISFQQPPAGYPSDSVFENIYWWKPTFIYPTGGTFWITLGDPSNVTLTRILTGDYAYGAYFYGMLKPVFNNCQISSVWSGSPDYHDFYLATCTGATLNYCKAGYAGAGYDIASSDVTLNYCTADGCDEEIYNRSGVGNKSVNCSFGKELAGTYTIKLLEGKHTLYGCLLGDTYDTLTSLVQSASLGSYVRFHEYNNVDNDHRGFEKYGKYLSTGTSLADTTVHTAGGFAIRYEPLSSTNSHTWTFNIPTGNIQNKTMMVGVWCKINSATYYAGTHQLPRLTIDYDSGTAAYVQATETTDWQFLPLPFTPTTTYGQITVTLSARTDATTTDAYVYWDDFKTLYPAETPLNAQTFDLWADALPVTPPIATVLSAIDVWSVSTATAKAITSAMGEHVGKKLLTTSKFIGLK